jgi:hypothetical protein
MARKKLHKDEEEEEEYGPPPFDEKKYLRTEMESAKASILASILGIIMAVVATGILAATHDFTIGVGAGIVAAVAVRPMLGILRLDTKSFQTMAWLGTYFSYFVSFVAFWILLINPPVMDLSPPHLSDSTAPRQELGSQIRITFTATDNSALGSVTVTIRLPGGTEQTFSDMEQVTATLFRLDLNFTAVGAYSYKIRAEDDGGRSTSLDGSFEIMPTAPPAIELIAPSNGSDIAVDTQLTLHISDNVRVSGVFYTLDGKNDTRFLLKPDKKGYQSYPKTEIYRIKTSQAGPLWTGGAHILWITATDTAGNTANATYSFTLK